MDNKPIEARMFNGGSIVKGVALGAAGAATWFAGYELMNHVFETIG